MSDPTVPDPYDPKPTFWQEHPHLGWGLWVFALTAVLTYAAFPPANIGEAGYVLAAPALLWAWRAPRFKPYALTLLAANVVAWTWLLSWLGHAYWLAPFLLGPFVGALATLWYLAAWWWVPKMRGHRAMVRLLGVGGLAALWVLGEWLRGALFGGFPWLPLAASQWQRPLVLQSASWGGAWTVSFVLVVFSCGVAAYAHRIFFEGAVGLRKRSPEFMAALMLLVFSSFPFLAEMMGAQRQKLARVALVQPNIPQGEKWAPEKAREVLRTIEQVTREANDAGVPDAIFWPEAVVPWTLHRDPNVQAWIESVARRTGKPLVLGAVFTRGAGEGEEWFNGAFLADPVAGLQEPGYAKRKLVPFGEFVPFRPMLGWLTKFVPLGSGDFSRGDSVALIPLTVNRAVVPLGPLICYEDIFPALARDSVLSGAELLVVLTNNGWFGEGGAAYQHATHSVLRAVENRRPVVRVGNAGWSGWIDEFGHIRARLQDEDGSVYFRGHDSVNITRDLRWAHRSSYYTEHGDWFLGVAAGLATVAYYLLLTLHPPKPKLGETVF